MSIHAGLEKTTKELEIKLVFGGYEFRGRIPEMVMDSQI